MKVIAKLEATTAPELGADFVARGFALDCHSFAGFDFATEGNGTCPVGGFRCPFQKDCEDITAADWLRILEVENDG